MFIFFKNKLYDLIVSLYKIRHIGFEIYNRSIFVRNLKKNLKKIIPTKIFNYYQKKK